MGSHSGKYLGVGIPTMIYGLILCPFWGWFIWASRAKLQQNSLTTAEVLTALIFASVPLMLIVTGFVLCSSRTGVRLRIVAAAITTLLLGAKTVLASNLAFEARFHQNSFFLIGPETTYWALMLFVAVPSGLLSLVLAGVSATLSGSLSEKFAVGTDDKNNPGLAHQPMPSKIVRLWGTVALVLAGELAAIAIMWFSGISAPVTARELLAAYRDNAATADAKYKGKWLEVKGSIAESRTISTMAPGSTTLWITLKADDPNVPGAVTLIVHGDFPFIMREPGSTFQDFEKLIKGQEIIVRGVCSGMTTSGVSVENPIIVK